MATSARRQRVRRVRQPDTTRGGITGTKGSRRVSTLSCTILRSGISLVTIGATSGGHFRFIRGTRIYRTLQRTRNSLRVMFLTRTVLISRHFRAISRVMSRHNLLQQRNLMMPFVYTKYPSHDRRRLSRSYHGAQRRITRLYKRRTSRSMRGAVNYRHTGSLTVRGL